MRIEGSIALVTGANRGLVRAFAKQLVHRGAARVYAAARRPATVVDPSLTPIELDITDSERVTEVAKQLTDVTLLVNNAGVQNSSSFMARRAWSPPVRRWRRTTSGPSPCAEHSLRCWG